MNYTVMLLYPDYVSDEQETFLTHVEAETPELAAKAGKAQAALHMRKYHDTEFDKPEDFRVLFTTPGHILDCYSEP